MWVLLLQESDIKIPEKKNKVTAMTTEKEDVKTTEDLKDKKETIQDKKKETIQDKKKETIQDKKKETTQDKKKETIQDKKKETIQDKEKHDDTEMALAEKGKPALKRSAEPKQGGKAKKPAIPAADLDHDVTQLIGEEPPVVLRREQLNADFRAAAEEEEEVGDEGDEEEDGEEGEAKPKRARAKGKAKPKSSAKAKAKGKAKAKASAKNKAEKSAGSKSEKKPAAPKVKKGKKEEKDETESKEVDSKTVKTFARRYCPQDPVQADRHKAIQAVYESEIAPKLFKQSSFQAGQLWANPFFFWWLIVIETISNRRRKLEGYGFGRGMELSNQSMQDSFYKLCMRSFRDDEAETYNASYEIAHGLVAGFFQDALIRPSALLSITFCGGYKNL